MAQVAVLDRDGHFSMADAASVAATDGGHLQIPRLVLLYGKKVRVTVGTIKPECMGFMGEVAVGDELNITGASYMNGIREKISRN